MTLYFCTLVILLIPFIACFVDIQAVNWSYIPSYQWYLCRYSICCNKGMITFIELRCYLKIFTEVLNLFLGHGLWGYALIGTAVTKVLYICLPHTMYVAPWLATCPNLKLWAYREDFAAWSIGCKTCGSRNCSIGKCTVLQVPELDRNSDVWDSTL